VTDAVLDEVLEEIEIRDPICRGCGRPMPTRQQWNNADEAERLDLLEDGYVSPRGHGCFAKNAEQLAAGRAAYQERRRVRDAEARSVFWRRYGEIYKDHASNASIARALGCSDDVVSKRVAAAAKGIFT
jgi:predicted Fe-S protein YdhL (DUF1289 family)